MPSPTRPSAFALLNLQQMRQILTALQSNDAALNRRMYDGDMWLDGNGWIGPQPRVGDPDFASVSQKIRRAFVSQNVIREIARRHRGALVGREPLYGVTPKLNIDKYKKAYGLRASDPAPRRKTLDRFVQNAVKQGDPELSSPEAEAQRQLAQEVEDALDEWCDKRGFHNILRRAVITLLLETRATLRLFIPPERMDEIVDADGPGKGIKATNLSEAMDYIYLQAPDNAQAAVLTDPSTMRDASLFVTRELSGPNMAEVLVQNMGTIVGVQMSLSGQSTIPGSGDNESQMGMRTGDAADSLVAPRDVPRAAASPFGSQGDDVAEVAYIDGEYTLIRIVRENKPEEQAEQSAKIKMGRRLPVYEMRADPMITPQIRQNQKQLNRSLTMMGNNTDLAGFLERVFFNTEQPVATNSDDDAEETEANVQVPNYLNVGAGTSTFLNGITYTDENGVTKIANPSLVYRDPVSPEALIATKNTSYKNMLQEAQQTHVLLSDDIPLTGESRRQAMADFMMSLLENRPVVEAAIRWMIETLLAMAASFLNEPGKYDALRATADVRLEVAPLMAEDMRMILGAVAQRLMSRETAQIRFNIDDPEAERLRILDDLADMAANPLLMPAQADPAGAGSDMTGTDPNPDQNNPSSTPTTGTQ